MDCERRQPPAQEHPEDWQAVLVPALPPPNTFYATAAKTLKGLAIK